MLKINRLGFSQYKTPSLHISRRNEEYILYAVYSGCLCLRADNEDIEMHPGDIRIFKKGAIQSGTLHCLCEFYYMHFDSDGIADMQIKEDEYAESFSRRLLDILRSELYSTECYDHMKLLLPESISISDTDAFSYFLGMMKMNMITEKKNDLYERLKISFEAVKILIELEKMAVLISKKELSRYRNISKIVEYMNLNFCKEISGASIEKDLNLNFDYANRIFRGSTGCSIMKYRNALRINKAKEELALTNHSISDIAFKTGFSSIYHFSRYFKKEVGITPSAYREANREIFQ